MSHLAFLVETLDALPEKSSPYAACLSALRRDRELELRTIIRRQLFALDHYESWVSGRLNVELYNLQVKQASGLEAMNIELCRRIVAAKGSATRENGKHR